MNLGFLPQLFTFAGKTPKNNEIEKIAKIKTILMIRIVFSSFGSVGPAAFTS